MDVARIVSEVFSCQSHNGDPYLPFLPNHSAIVFCCFVLVFFRTLLLSSFWTSRGHRCRPFLPPGSRLQIFLSRMPVGLSNPAARPFFIECLLLTHALLALSASQFVHEKKSPRNYTSMHSGGFELTKLTYTRLEDNLIRHRGDRLYRYM